MTNDPTEMEDDPLDGLEGIDDNPFDDSTVNTATTDGSSQQEETTEVTTGRSSSSDDNATVGDSIGGLSNRAVNGGKTSSTDGLGHVLASSEIEVSREDANIQVFVKTSHRDSIEVGDYLRVPYPDGISELFAVVDALRYAPQTEVRDTNDAYNQIAQSEPLNESEYKLVADLDSIAILNTGGDAIERGIVNRVPKPNTGTSKCRNGNLLRRGLNIPQDGVFAGYLSVGGSPMTVAGSKFPYFLQNPGYNARTGEVESGEPAIFRHGLIAGSTGAGRAHFTKNLLRQLVDATAYPVESDQADHDHAPANIVVFDPEAEYDEMRDDPGLTDAQQRELEEHNIAYGGIDNLRTFVPEVGYTTRPSVETATNISIPFSVVEAEPRLLMPFQQMSEITSGAIKEVVRSYFDLFDGSTQSAYSVTETPTYADFTSFIEFLDNNIDQSPFWTDTDMNESTWRAVKDRVDRAAYDAVFDAGGQPFTELTSELFTPGQMTVIPTSHIRGAKEELVVLSILSYIIENKLTDYNVDPNVKHTPMLVVLDEAHKYLSSPTTRREEYIVHKARQAVKQGRKEQLGLFAVTQNPDDIDGEVLKQMNTNFFLQLRQEVVRDVASVPREYTRDIPKFGKGQAVAVAPDVEPVEVVGLPFCVTSHRN